MDDKQKATSTVVSGAYVRSLAEAAILYSRQALISTDASGLINAWNPAAEQMFGYSSAAALGMPLMTLIPAERSAEHSRIQREVADGLVVEATDTVWLRREGTRLNVAVTTTALFDADNRVLGTASAIVDISVRKQLEARLAFLESIISSSSDAIFTRDIHRRLITSWNDGAERLFGYRADEIIGQPIDVLIPPELRETEFLEVAARIKLGVRVEPYQTVRLHKDGHQITISLSASPVFDEFGALVGTCGIARDVSDAARRAEETERWALQDPLTNLPNRRALVDRIEVVLGKTRRSGFHAGLLFVDLDDFKRINDLYGHAGGDAVLVEVATRIQSVLRAADTVARIGGDEFVVLLDQIGADRVAALTHARGVGEKLVAALANIDAGAALSCSASVGLLVFSDGVHSVEEILHRADHAMYEAKKAGKNQLAIVED